MKSLVIAMIVLLLCVVAHAGDYRKVTGTSSSGAVVVKATPGSLWHVISISANGTAPAGTAVVAFNLQGETTYPHQVVNGTAGAVSTMTFNSVSANYMVFQALGLDTIQVTPTSLNATLVPTVRYSSWP